MQRTQTATTTESTPKPTSHDFATELELMAQWLRSRPAFSWPRTVSNYTPIHTWDKEEFVACVKGLGTGTKEFTDSEVKFTVTVGQSKIVVMVPRNKVCRLVRPAEYDCEPFLSQSEEESLGGAA